MTTLYLPNFRPALAQVSSGNNTELATATAALEAWASIYSKISSGKWNKAPAFCLAAAMSYPSADVERLCIAAEWVTVLYMWDDLLDVPDTTSNLMYNGRAAEEIQKHMTGVLTGSKGDVNGDALVVADAYRSRRILHAIRDPDEAYYHPIMKQTRDATNDILAWANDIYSFNKEQACGNHQNLVAIVALERDIPIQSAISYVTLMVQAAIDRYLDARARFPNFGSETDEVVKKYIWGLECVCTGFIFWHFRCDRYFGGGFGDIKDSFAVRLLPRHENPVEPMQRLRYEAVPGVDLGGGVKSVWV